MKALIIDHISEHVAPALKARGIEVDHRILPTTTELAEIIGSYALLLMRGDPFIDKNVLDAASELKMLCVCSAGINHIDLKYAAEKGIAVASAPGVNGNAVAELTFGKMLDLSRQSAQANREVKVLKIWNKYKWMGRELKGKTLGIIGFGSIGKRVGELARAFGMNVIACDPLVSFEQGMALGAQMTDMDTLLSSSDFVTIHIPLSEQNKGLISTAQIAKMKPDAMLLNMSRGGIIDEKALLNALLEGRLGGAAVDVMAAELTSGGLTDNAGFDSPLFALDNFLVTPHIGGCTYDALDGIGEVILGKIDAHFNLNR